MHKLSRKSDELIPPAQHPLCSRSFCVLLNKFISLPFCSPLRRSVREGRKKKYEKEKTKALSTCCVFERSPRDGGKSFVNDRLLFIENAASSSAPAVALLSYAAIVLLLRNFQRFLIEYYKNFSLLFSR